MRQNPISPNSVLVETLQSFRKEMNALATDDIATVATHLGEMIESKVSENPYVVLATAAGIGFGLSSLDLNHLKCAAIRVGKLVAMKAISNMETNANGLQASEQKSDQKSPQIGEQDEQQLQLEA